MSRLIMLDVDRIAEVIRAEYDNASQGGVIVNSATLAIESIVMGLAPVVAGFDNDIQQFHSDALGHLRAFDNEGQGK